MVFYISYTYYIIYIIDIDRDIPNINKPMRSGGYIINDTASGKVCDGPSTDIDQYGNNIC